MSPFFCIVMPAYNEEECIADVVTMWTDYLKKTFADKPTKLIVINDGSKDNTGKILDAMAPSIDNLLVVHQPNGGHGNAVVNGYKKAIELNADYVFQTDSDDQFVAEDIDKLWQHRNASAFVLGYREVRYDAPARLIITRILKYTIFGAYGTLINDANIPFRLIKGSFLKKLMAQMPDPEPFAPNIFLAVMAKKSGQKTFDVPITHKERQTGTVSILRWKLLKVCMRSFGELLQFRFELNTKVAKIKA